MSLISHHQMKMMDPISSTFPVTPALPHLPLEPPHPHPLTASSLPPLPLPLVLLELHLYPAQTRHALLVEHPPISVVGLWVQEVGMGMLKEEECWSS